MFYNHYKRKQMNLQKLLCVSLLSLLISSQASAETNYTDKELKQIAKKAIQTVGGKLKHTLGQKVKKGGFENAALFCSKEATSLAKEASSTLPQGVSIKRITTKPRNSNNQATKAQSLVLEELEQKLKIGKLPKMLVKKISKNHYQVYKPLVIGKKCLNCHGDTANLNQNAYKIISENYPDDKATNYKLGQLRGVFLVDIIK